MEERQSYLSSTQKYKQALENQVSGLKKNAMSIAIQGLIFGGLAVGAWYLVKSLSSGSEKKEGKKSGNLPAASPGFISGIVASIQGAIASFLLSIAREKILDVIQKYMEKQDANSGDPA